MDSATLHFLLSPEGRAHLAALGETTVTPADELALAGRLRAQLGPDRARAVLEQVLLRQRAAAKFSRAAEMVFTRDGLEQATAEPLAIHRARRFQEAGYRLVVDLGCGIGGDALALAAAAAVIGIDRDPTRLAMARENVAAYGRREHFLPVAADLQDLPPFPAEAFCFDPARRTGGGSHGPPARRLRAAASYQPPLSLIDHWRPRVPSGAVKVGPGIDYDDLPAEAEVEFVSYKGEVREGVLWYGDLRRCGRGATLLPGGPLATEPHRLTTDDDPGEPVSVGPPAAFVYEPDGAVIRAHLVQALAARLGASLLSPDIAYLTANELIETPFARAFRLEAWFPFNLKRLRRHLREQGIGRVTIKKRGSPLDPDDLRRALGLEGESERVLILTQVLGEHTVLITQPAS